MCLVQQVQGGGGGGAAAPLALSTSYGSGRQRFG